MNRLLRSLSCSFLLAAAPAFADATADAHPASKVVRDYNQCMLTEAWDKAAALIEPESMDTLRDDYVERAKRPGVMTLDDEKLLLEKFAVKDLDDIKKVEGKKFYTTYHAIVKAQKPVPEEALKRVRDTTKITILGVIDEKELKKAHVLVRSKYDNGKANVENLELISLVLIDGKWLVGLNEQTPKVTPGSLAGPAPKAPAAKPVTK
jgi:hypothetical protein